MVGSQTRTGNRRHIAAPSADRLFYTSSSIANPETNLHPFFYTCMSNWESIYSEEEKSEIISMLPTPYRTFSRDESGKLKCPLKLDFVSDDQTFRDGIARFQRDISEGYWTNTWRSNAAKASAERANGVFDDYLAQHAEELFGEGDHQSSVAGQSGDEDGEDDTAFVSRERGEGRRKRDKIRKSERSKKSVRHLTLTDRDVDFEGMS